MNRAKLVTVCALLCVAMLGMTSCSASHGAGAAAEQGQPAQSPQVAVQERVSGVGFYFDTVVTLTLYGAPEGLLDDMWTACNRYENLLSKTVPGSDVDRINTAAGKTVTVDPETWEILRQAKEISAASDGAFSVTIAPISALWDFTNGTQRMPSADELAENLPKVDDKKIQLGPDHTVTLPAGMMVDLGGIAKGYIADQIAKMAAGRVTGAVLNFGGNVYIVGQKPDGSSFRVGIRDPQGDESSYSSIVSVRDLSVVTSGVYERYFEKDGIRYHHILDPKTGISAVTDLASATIVNASSMKADAVATACIVLGREGAMALLQQLGLDGMLIGPDGSVTMTEGFADQYHYISTQ